MYKPFDQIRSSYVICCLILSQTAKGAKIFSAAVAATIDSQQTTKEGEEKIKLHTHSYCCLDYAQVSLSLTLILMLMLHFSNLIRQKGKMILFLFLL